ncbi:MAG: copper-translocating P-type ATPase [Spirochaetaceae bacterium]|nr:copper-translocating P-type ATPase [Spirochaetaceae bacterium]
MKKILLKIGGMSCSACSAGLEKSLNRREGIIKASVNLVMNNATIEYDENLLDLAKIEEFVAKAGFESLGIDNLQWEENRSKKEKLSLWATAITATLLFLISMSHMFGLKIPFVHPEEFPRNYALTQMVLALFAIFLGRKIIATGTKTLFHGMPNMDSLVTIGVVAAFIFSTVNTTMIFSGKIDFEKNLYFESCAFVLCFIQLGKFIENRNKDKTREALQGLVTITPQNAILWKDGKEITATIDEVNVGDILLCKPGQKFAVDGTVVQGESSVDESFITGESLPVTRRVGDKVLAGSVNFHGVILYQAEAIGKNSTVSEIVHLVVQAAGEKAPIAKIADKISGIFVPIVISLALLAFVAHLFLGNGLSVAINAFVSTLVVACPCSLGLATPLSMVISLGICSKKGILVKSGAALETAAKLQTIFFDKTGTLTKGKLKAEKIFIYNDEEEDSLLEKIASIEVFSEHPMGKAVVDLAKERNLSIPTAENVKNLMGGGIEGTVKGDKILLGNRQLMEDSSVKIEDACLANENFLTDEGAGLIFVAQNGKIAALLGIRDEERDEAKDTISRLKELGVKSVMLTGDNEKTARKMAHILGIHEIRADVRPKDKAEILNEEKKKCKVAMCGDGINDSISLVAAHLGISMKSGTDVAQNSADIILMNDSLLPIAELVTLSKKTMKNVKQNLFWAFFYNSLMLPVAMGILSPWGIILNPAIASLAMTLSSLSVVLNSLRLKKLAS